MDEVSKTLIRKRASIKSRLTNFSNFINGKIKPLESLDNTLVIQLEQRVATADAILENYIEVQDKIELNVSEDALQEQFNERNEFENSFFNIVACAKNILYNIQNIQTNKNQIVSAASSVSTDSHNNNVELSQVKLPTINLPTFDGSHESWLEYRDTYESLIHNNQSISNIQKFHYLRASLTGGATQVVKSIEFSSANYEVAWDVLRERYNNERLLIQSHVKAIFNIEGIGRESAHKIRKLIDTLTKHLRALGTLKQPVNEWDTLIIFIIISKLDSVTARHWEEYKAGKDIPKLEDLKGFLKARADLLETVDLNNSEKRMYKESKTSKSFINNEILCAFCSGKHSIYNCETFLKLAVKERAEKIKNLKLCINCFKKNHYAKQCFGSKCRKCGAKHNTLLHNEGPQSEKEEKPATSQVNKTVSASSVSLERHVLLATALVQILDVEGNSHCARALLDTGSQTNFITKELCDRLRLNKQRINHLVGGINNVESKIDAQCSTTIHAINNNYRLNISFLVLPAITGYLPSIKLDIESLQIPCNIQLADPAFNKPAEIDLLIGAEHFWDLIAVGQIKLGKNLPILQKTLLGWIVSGEIAETHQTGTRSICNLSNNVQRQLEQFWLIEDMPQSETTILSKEERDCESHFKDTVERTPEGRFVVTLPLKESSQVLGESRIQAEKRLLALERKLNNNATLKDMYTSFLAEYEALGDMSRINEMGENESNVSYYLPHHGVLKESSTTTKLRVVFDASALSSTGKSLNDIQMVGPVIQDDLVSILLRFRKHKYVISGDIEKMYRRVLINPKQRTLQRILWRFNESDPIQTYELNTVTYGMAAASFLSIRCLHELAFEIENTFPKIANIIKNDFYVDDLLTGTDCVKEARYIVTNLTNVLKSGSFNLRKWLSNDMSILSHLKSNDTDKIHDFGTQNNLTKTLGLIWNSNSDILTFKIGQNINSKVTKRAILSEISQIFDPLGLLSPCIVVAKLILQKLWQENLSWDESVSLSLHTKWLKFRNELCQLNNVQIPRRVICEFFTDVEIHGFSDASENAFGGCIYVRSMSKNNIMVRLLCSKSKVAPLKSLTVPRLELCGGVILVRLMNKVVKSLKLSNFRRFYWTDSSVLLAWLNQSPNKLKPFVANRVVEIQNLSEISDWRHVRTHDNPADLLTRGLTPCNILENQMWWYGPTWLSKSVKHWPQSQRVEIIDLPEIRSVMISRLEEFFPFDRFSKLKKLINCMAYCFRFVNNVSNRETRKYGPIVVDERNRALTALLKIAQRESFSRELGKIAAGKAVDRTSKILSLTPFFDARTGLIRVGGRIQHSHLDYNIKHPILLDGKHYLSKLIFRDEHIRLAHAGAQLLLSSVRERYWVTTGKNLAKQVVRNCIVCFRAKPKVLQPLMGQLPKERVTPSRPFDTVGIDYAGPFVIKDRQGRGCKQSKCYVCVFICFSTKAVHLELVSNLSTNGFILALRRFVARRGIPSVIYSDNGKNFVGAKNELRELGGFLKNKSNKLTELCAEELINWKFIPPYSPHFGGIWEAAVKSTKYHLVRVARGAILTFEELCTLLTQIESILNSRPLSPLTTDPNDLVPLTPAHFLIGTSLTQLPERSYEQIPDQRLKRFELIQKMKQIFWKRWSQEYLSTLQSRTKWRFEQDIAIGSMVLLKDDNLPPMRWQIGRVVQVHPGADSVVRVVTVRTSKGETRRAVAKVCLLPFEENVKETDITVQ